MGLLSRTDEQALREALSDLERPVRLLFFTQTLDCDTCADARQILDELSAVSDRVTIEEVNLILDRDRAAAYGIDRAPSIVLLAGEEAADTRIRFVGAPAGYDFMALVDAVMAAAGTSDQALGAESQTRLASVSSPTTIQVFVTPTCAYCPQAVAIANRMALASPQITATTIQATEFHDLARQYRVSGVPKTVVNDTIEILGALPEQEFVAQALGLDPTV
jgi:glutaredoxin-like protein